MIFSFVFTSIFDFGLFPPHFQTENQIFFKITSKILVTKCPNHIRMLPQVLGHRKPSGQFNLGRSLWNTLYNFIVVYLLHIFQFQTMCWSQHNQTILTRQYGVLPPWVLFNIIGFIVHFSLYIIDIVQVWI